MSFLRPSGGCRKARSVETDNDKSSGGARGPRWWLLYLVVPAMFGATLAAEQTIKPIRLLKFVEFLIIALAFFWIKTWLKENARAIEKEDYQPPKKPEPEVSTTYSPIGQAIPQTDQSDVEEESTLCVR